MVASEDGETIKQDGVPFNSFLDRFYRVISELGDTHVSQCHATTPHSPARTGIVILFSS